MVVATRNNGLRNPCNYLLPLLLNVRKLCVDTRGIRVWPNSTLRRCTDAVLNIDQFLYLNCLCLVGSSNSYFYILFTCPIFPLVRAQSGCVVTRTGQGDDTVTCYPGVSVGMTLNLWPAPSAPPHVAPCHLAPGHQPRTGPWCPGPGQVPGRHPQMEDRHLSPHPGGHQVSR